MSKFIKKNYFWCFPILLTAVMLALRLIAYTEVDDIMMMKMAESFSFNPHSEQLIFLGEVYGYILKFLYTLLPAVNWFSVLYLVNLNISYISILKLISKRTENVGIISFILSSQAFMLLDISFTVVAFIMCGAGMLWGIEYVNCISKKNIGHLLYSFFLLFSGFGMRRSSVVYCIILVFLPLAIFAVKNKKNSIAAICLIFALCIASNFIVGQLHSINRNSMPADSYYNEFNEYRSAASDAAAIKYADHAEYFEEKGISKSDFRLYNLFIYADKEVYTNETVKNLALSRSTKDKYEKNPIQLLKDVLSPGTVIRCVFLYVFAISAVILFVLFKKKRLELFVSALFVAACEGYLFFVKRAVARVVNPVAILGIIILVYIVSSENSPFEGFKKLKKESIKRLTAFALAATVAVSALSVGVYSVYKYKNNSFRKEASDYINSDKENLYVCSPSAFYLLNDSKLSLMSNKDETAVYDIIGDWWSYTYYWYSALDKAGLDEYKDNAIKLLLDSRVRFITNYDFITELLTDYYSEHYGLNVYAEKVDEVNGMLIYKLSIIN